MSTEIALSEGEALYFSSAGENTAGVVPGSDVTPAVPVDTGAPAADITPTPTPAPDAPTDAPPEEDGDIVLDAEGRARDPKGRFVPHAALHAERVKRQGKEVEIGRLREQLARADERLALLNEVLGPGTRATGQPQAPAQLDVPDPETDPFGAIQAALRQNEELRKELDALRTSQSAASRQTQVQTAFERDARTFMSQEPQFEPAIAHLVQQRHTELNLLGLTEQADRDRAIKAEVEGLVETIARNGGSPSRTLFEMAKARGFRAAAPAPQAPAGPTPADRVREQAAIVARTPTLSGTGNGNDILTMEALAAMSQQDFEAALKKVGGFDGLSRRG